MQLAENREVTRSELTLVFSEGERRELLESSFVHPLIARPLRCIRGRTGESRKVGTFGWTTAVKAICILCVLQRLKAFEGNLNNQVSEAAGISGGRGSLAASLDYSVAKEPAWLHEMFGADSTGRSILKRFLKRSNPELKRPGPTRVSLSESFVRSTSIRIVLGEKVVEDANSLRGLVAELGGWTEAAPMTPVTQQVSSNTNQTAAPTEPMGDSLWHLVNRSKYYDQILSRFVSEASWALHMPEVFSKCGHRDALKRISVDPSFQHVCSFGDPLNSLSDQVLPTAILQGLLTRELRDYCQSSARPFRIGITPAQVASIAILKEMQRQGLDMCVDFGFSLGEDLVRQVGDEDGGLDGFVVTIASAASVMGMTGSQYVPHSLMPRISHSVIRKTEPSPKSMKALVGEFLMVSDAPSTPQFCLESLLRRGVVAKKDVSLGFANPSEVTRQMLHNGSDAMTILGFPHYSLLELLGGLSLVDCGGRDGMSKEAILFVKRRIADDPKLSLGLQGYLRGSWLSLSNSRQLLEATLKSLLLDTEYTRALGLTIGAHHLGGGSNAAEHCE